MNKITSTKLAEAPHVMHGFLGRQGGTSPKPWDSLNVSYDLGDVKARVDENRARICVSMGVGSKALYTPKQVHGVNAIRVSKSDSSDDVSRMEADAIWTTDDNIAVAVQTADCAPLLFASSDGSVIGAIHAGWRGAVAGIATRTIDMVCRDLLLTPDRFSVAIGPCIGYDAFEVGPEVVDAIKTTMPIDDIVKKGNGDRSYVDLAGLLQRQLKHHGVNHVEVLRRCTATHTDEYFSYRASKGRRGGQLSVITRRNR